MPDALQPQDAFAELARITLAEQSLETVMDTIARLAKRTAPGASEVSVTIVDRGQATTIASTGPSPPSSTSGSTSTATDPAWPASRAVSRS